MVTAYCIMKLSRRKPQDYEAYYRNILETSTNTKSIVKCRVCLKEGKLLIFNQNICNDIVDLYKTFVGGYLREDDELPKHLCNTCFKFFRAVILFKNTAVKSDNYLRSIEDDFFKINETESMLQEKSNEESMKEETMQQTDDDFHDYDDDDELHNKPVEIKNSWEESQDEKIITNLESKPEEISKNIKVEKQETTKYTPKTTCKVCKKVINKSYIKEHMTMHDPNPEKYVCDVCGKSFRLRCAYHNHSLRHRSDFPHKCQYCPYKARYGELLKTHMRTHTGDYRYMCTECPARFLFKSNLNSHMLKHKEPQLKCDACKRAFHTKLALQRHVDTDHLGIKNHICNMCGKAFGYRNAMMKHQRHVHKREKFHSGRMPSYLAAEQKQDTQGM